MQYWTGERTGRDREDKEDYRVKLGVALCFSNRVNITEYYHNSSFLEHGGSPERAVKVALVNQIDAWLKNNNKYLKNESKISFQDVQDCLVLVSSSFSTQTSYENQTKKIHHQSVHLRVHDRVSQAPDGGLFHRKSR